LLTWCNAVLAQSGRDFPPNFVGCQKAVFSGQNGLSLIPSNKACKARAQFLASLDLMKSANFSSLSQIKKQPIFEKEKKIEL